MSAVARTLREDSRARQLRMTPAERLAEALALGRRAIASYAAAHGVDEREARASSGRPRPAARRPW